MTKEKNLISVNAVHFQLVATGCEQLSADPRPSHLSPGGFDEEKSEDSDWIRGLNAVPFEMVAFQDFKNCTPSLKTFTRFVLSHGASVRFKHRDFWNTMTNKETANKDTQRRRRQQHGVGSTVSQSEAGGGSTAEARRRYGRRYFSSELLTKSQHHFGDNRNLYSQTVYFFGMKTNLCVLAIGKLGGRFCGAYTLCRTQKGPERAANVGLNFDSTRDLPRSRGMPQRVPKPNN
ncbi:hypothetical protein F2P81_001214 [Scophthalmus maximus]|uniref:Uncharacterized protein n=1 Tax=Scophthalmus maximus TaxID=52904 RepID=A0A6A4TYL6_SCOMX|nr:hypothetical protein F2P81_001214 [Scophthalmus maximus]